MSQFTRQKASTPAEIQYARRSAAIASVRQRRSSSSAATTTTMRPTDFFGDMDDQGSTMAMDVDDLDPLEYLGGDGVIGDNKLTDLDFFNSFEDDFDESDMTAPAN
ncbi:PREDICTED: small acidic protein 1 [Fragaria vesca subsp. vesca]|uniref:small acidic protein 1 n=1 Tax=Fragaria vesca subsp. vesca TaxID=101020 RepID=UPI0002C2F0AC|nr:PREDICTED: small acidic protein 1 [Fragaria vesca subsp. vesca]XP_011462433.1 PREDICTED: small acidic protein 1 [Fragaria vesca subsp. vesca]